MTHSRLPTDTPDQGAQTRPKARDVFDVIVVGAGVVGCAVARRFTLEGARVAVVEKAADILDGASKANSAILHTGFDAPPGSLELSCIRAGYREYREIHDRLNLPLDKTGAHVIAWNGDEVEKLTDVLRQAHTNGLDDVRMIDARELAMAEPGLAQNALAAVHVPGEAIIDPWSAPYAYLRQSIANGGRVFLSCEVTGGEFDGAIWRLQTTRGEICAHHVINCAGLYGDRLDQALLGVSGFSIKPRKGQFVVFDKAASRLVNSILLPVPTRFTKGVVVCKTIFGNLLVGPTAEDQDSRTDASTDQKTIEALIQAGIEKVPALKDMPVTATYAGLRPATEHKEYRIEATPERKWITVGGIRSTGLSSALGIARHVFGLYRNLGQNLTAIDNPALPRKSAILSQGGARDWQKNNHGPIVCHCELVTEREILAALMGPLAARSLSALKRQTRVSMGQCQGFYCSAHLAELTKGRFETIRPAKACHEQ
jgi:glycerol-3-phosphate dehydrogenase